ncbi:MAG: hypothetical protein QNJ51_07195 [Calothrix sp. MO_167.B12]|nr:hypothetical protein [Calothrix sp. MO_167.B12]
MLKKSLAFGLLAASLMVAPGAAFAQSQTQVNDQLTDQSGAALDGSINVQNSRSNSRQNQNATSYGRGRYGRYGRYRRGCRPGRINQAQASTQTTGQSGVAENGSINAQNSNTNSGQRQNAFKVCR